MNPTVNFRGDATTSYFKRIQLYNITKWLMIYAERFKKENLIYKKQSKGLKCVNSKMAKFYISPKVHKENNPGRSVINSIKQISS